MIAAVKLPSATSDSVWMVQPGEAQHSELHRAYRSELLSAHAVRAIRTGALVVFITNVAFLALDRYAYPELFWKFFTARMALNAFLVVIAGWLCRRYPSASQLLLGTATGGLLLYVIHGADPLGGYYVGLLLLFSGLPMLLPLSVVENLALCSALTAGYAALPFATPDPIDWHRYAIQNLFLASAAFISMANCQQLNRSRFRDFVQRRELEEARDHLREMDRQKSRFTANVHHELRTPLTLMLAPIDTLLAGDLGAVSFNQRLYLQTMRENGLRLLKLINQLLDLARIESRQHKIDLRPTDLGRIAARILDSARPLAERKSIALEQQGLETLPIVHVDSDALEKILVNLIGNALKFTEPGGRIRLSAESHANGIALEIEDSGIGIPNDQLLRVFDRFAQVDGSATRKHEGTGIGLALVKELVELHGGEVSAFSEGLGHGARFRIVLPQSLEARANGDLLAPEEVVSDAQGKGLTAGDAFAAVGAELGLQRDLGIAPEDKNDYLVVELRRSIERFEASELMPPQNASIGRDQGPEILVVEDNADMRRLFALLLGREFRVRLAANGRQGLEAVRERAPDLVLSDVMMPELSGLELCSALKADPATARIPVVLVTSKAEGEMKIEGLERGADDYVTKPFHPRELLARVRNLVRLHWLQGELAEQNAALEHALEELKGAEVQLVQSERLAAVGELAAGVAHEVNNPVNFALNAVRTLRTSVSQIRGVAARVASLNLNDQAGLKREIEAIEALRDDAGFDDMEATIDELVGIVVEGLERTSRLVMSLRDFAKPGRGPHVRVDVRRGIESTAQLLRRAIADAGAQLIVNLPDDLPLAIGDPGALNQIYLNLIKNALEAFDGRGGTIRIDATRDDTSLVLRFNDDGPGIDADIQGQLFQPFFTTKSAGQGSGLGLSISRRIAEQHGGQLLVSSETDVGSTFILILPAESAALE